MQDVRTAEARALDAELDKLHRDAEAIDPYRYRRRKRLMAAIGIGALGAGLVSVVLIGIDKARNPCQRVHDHYCKIDPASLNCTSYKGVLQESVEDASPAARGAIRHQCETHIKRLEIDQGIKVR